MIKNLRDINAKELLKGDVILGLSGHRSCPRFNVSRDVRFIPTEPGYYWWKYSPGSMPEVVWVSGVPGSLQGQRVRDVPGNFLYFLADGYNAIGEFLGPVSPFNPDDES